MAKLYLYTAFHLNLAFSSIPEEQYALAVDRCYWPLMDILEKFANVKFGLEFTGYTLQKIKEVDYTFIEKLKELHRKGKCEFLGSGISQAIFPLIPKKVNEENIKIGNQIYQDILGVIPVTGYVNEQCFAEGIAEVYKSNGYKNIIVDYDNANLFNRYPEEYKYRCHKLKTNAGELNLIWSNSIAFQKLQRYAFGEMELESYLEYLNSQCFEKVERTLCMYGSDLEIFDYKPGNYDWFYNPNGSKEMDRLHKIFEYLNNSSTFNFILPGEAAVKYNSNNEINISTAQYPVVCKKQPKYNVVRWAVSGLKNTKMNTECSRIYEDLLLLDKFGFDVQEQWRDLCLLYGSDYRTKTTESKLNEYHLLLGKTQAAVEKKFSSIQEKGKEKVDYHFSLLNTKDAPIEKGFIYEYDIKFEQGEIFQDKCTLLINKEEVNFQLENVEYYRDKSIRKCKILMELPEIPSMEKIYGRFINGARRKVNTNCSLQNGIIETDTVKIKFSDRKKGTIESLVLKEISDISILGTINHGYYDDIRYSADYFSGHTILRERTLTQITDLDKSQVIYPDNINDYKVRIPIKSKINGEFGELWKIYFVYLNQSRVDIEYNFRFKDVTPIFFKTGIITFNPEFFNIETLSYAANNGGDVEQYSLKGRELNQTEMISLNVSANGCIGGTEGMFTVFDNKNEVIIQRDNSLLYTVPMIEYKEINEKYMLRLYHSLSETDDTGSIFWRGHSKFRMSITNLKYNLFNHGIISNKEAEK
ncbi:MAG: alpha-amylase [Firmicutes bacterium HGW-Firmicutes-13]|nr:MAG: alpha-amylase [Firmicutes bacterium HGW-Firmicutes-13]